MSKETLNFVANNIRTTTMKRWTMILAALFAVLAMSAQTVVSGVVKDSNL